MPKISIVIPIYNVQNYLKQCLDSVVNQTLKDIEIICVNDGSTDDCLKIINQYESKDNRIKVINKSNSGYGDSMNKGIEIATGEYIGIVEPDDFIELDMFETLYNKAQEVNADIVKSNFYKLLKSDGEKIIELEKLDKSDNYYNKVITPLKDLIVFTFPIYIWSGIYKRDFLVSNNIKFNNTAGASFQDNGFFFQTFSLAQRLCFVDKAFYYYRMDNPNSSFMGKALANTEKSRVEYDFISKFIQNHKDLEPAISYAYNYQKFHMYFAWYNPSINDEWLKIAYPELKKANDLKQIDFKLYDNFKLTMLNCLLKSPKKFLKTYENLTKPHCQMSFIEKIFSVKNTLGEQGKYHKTITILGLKIKIKNSNKTIEYLLQEKENLYRNNDELKTKFADVKNQTQQLQNMFSSLNTLSTQQNIQINELKSAIFDLFQNQYASESDASNSINTLLNKITIAPEYLCVDSNHNYLNILLGVPPFYLTPNKYNKDKVLISWEIARWKENIDTILQAIKYHKKVIYIGDSFLRSINTFADRNAIPEYKKGISVTIDDITPFYDATRASRLEKMLNDTTLVITDEQKQRARNCINKIIETHLTKYNHQPIFEPKIGRDGVKKVLVVDQSYGDMSIAKGLADDNTFKEMLECAIRENPDADIIVKTHPDTMVGSGGYYKGLEAHDNIYTQTEPINPISLIKYVDKVYVCTTQLGFEALMCGKEVHTFGMPFYAGWGLTVDNQQCERRTNTRTLEEVFYIAYIIYSHYVNPDKNCRCEIEEAMDYLLNLREKYNQVKQVVNV